MEQTDLLKKTKAELLEMAAELGIKISGSANKAEIADAIRSAQGEAEPGPEPETEPEQEAEAEPAAEEPMYDDVEIIKRVYIGPTLPGGLLTNGKILMGAEKSIMDYAAPEIGKHPKVRYLLVPMDQVSKAKKELRQGRGLYNKLYQDVAGEISGKGGNG